MSNVLDIILAVNFFFYRGVQKITFQYSSDICGFAALYKSLSAWAEVLKPELHLLLL